MTILLSLSILAIGWFVYSENKSDDFVQDENTENSTQTDTDGDGVVDSKDHCPDVAGKIDLFGCNDTDGDGISDELEQNNGTNPNNIDTDGDGVNDKIDECPIEKGTKKNNGCKEKEIDVVPITPVINAGDDVNKIITISYKGVQYKIKKGFTTLNGMPFNNSGWRYYNNKWENENTLGSGKWKAATTADINFVLARNAKKIDSAPGPNTVKTDTDGDGINDVLETANGTNPNKIDTDDDTVNDNIDQCPLAKGTKPKGCPESNTNTSGNKQKLSALFVDISNGNFISTANLKKWKNLYSKLSPAEKQDTEIKRWNKDIQNLSIE